MPLLPIHRKQFLTVGGFSPEKKPTPGQNHPESGPPLHPGQEGLSGQHPGLCLRVKLLLLTLVGSTISVEPAFLSLFPTADGDEPIAEMTVSMEVGDPSVSSLSSLGFLTGLGHSLLQCGFGSSPRSSRPLYRHRACSSRHIHCPSSQSQSGLRGHWCHR